jgi:hypothetical protein
MLVPLKPLPWNQPLSQRNRLLLKKLDNGSYFRQTIGTPSFRPIVFQSVDDFLRKAMGAKSNDRQIIEEEVGMQLDDPDLVGIPEDMVDAIDEAVEKYGDEALRHIALFCLGKWMGIHEEVLEQHIELDSIEPAVLTASDLTTLSSAGRLLSSVGSFGGDEEWRTMLKELTVQSVLEQCEEEHIDIGTFFNK